MLVNSTFTASVPRQSNGGAFFIGGCAPPPDFASQSLGLRSAFGQALVPLSQALERVRRNLRKFGNQRIIVTTGVFSR